MKLSDLKRANWHCHNSCLENVEVSSIEIDSRKVKPGSLFVALKGNLQDGHLFLDEAIERGARVLLIQKGNETPKKKSIPVISVPNTRLALADLAVDYYRHPSQDLFTVGVTGTNGKTTTTYWLESFLKQCGKRVGVLGTVSYNLISRVIKANRTTPDPILLAKYMAQIRDQGGDAVVLEVSSHALDQDRVANIELDGAIFTNLSQDHFDYHLNWENYYQTKRKLFVETLARSKKKNKVSVINIDDAYGHRLMQELSSPKLSFGFHPNAQFQASNLEMSIAGSSFLLRTPAQDKIPVKIGLPGRHNIANFLGALTSLSLLNVDFKDFLKEPKSVHVPGRLEKFKSPSGALIFIDYAHTDAALQNVLETLKPFVSGKLVLVFGCGGNRDQKKRKKMGEVAASLADHLILTSDNPRNEDPQQIISDILSGLTNSNCSFDVEPDREKAIRRSLKYAKEKDVVLIAGKGHETEQIIQDKVISFSDREIVQNYVQSHRTRN